MIHTDAARFSIVLCVPFAVLSAISSHGFAEQTIEIPSALLRIVESADIPAAVDGILDQIDVKEGRIVEAGALLARVNDSQARIRLTRAATDVDIAARAAKNDLATQLARKTLELSVTELNRAHEVNRSFANSVSERELNVLRLGRDKAKLELQQAKLNQQETVLKHQLKSAEYDLAQNELERHQIVAPIPGMVVRVNKHAGEWVAAGEVVVRIVRVDRVRAEGFIAASLAQSDLVGRAASIRVLTGDTANQLDATGEVVFVSPDADPVDQRVRVWVEFANPDLSLRPGLRGDVQILTKQFSSEVVAAGTPTTAKRSQ